MSKCPLWRHFTYYNRVEENFNYLFILQLVEATFGLQITTIQVS